MAASTKLQVVTGALRLLGMVAADEDPSAADSDYAETLYDNLREELIDKGLAYWPNTNRTTAEIPAVVVWAVTCILAGRLAPAFGAADPTVTDDDGKPVSATAKGFRDLRRHMTKPASGIPTRATYY